MLRVPDSPIRAKRPVVEPKAFTTDPTKRAALGSQPVGLLSFVLARPVTSSIWPPGLTFDGASCRTHPAADLIGGVRAENEDARTDAFDALGLRVAVLHEGVLAAGTHALRLDVSALPAGVYVVRSTTTAAVVSRRLTVAR